MNGEHEMDRDQAKAIQNQKVFVPLSAVLEVQAEFNRLVEQVNRDYARGMAKAIRTLGLPIDLPNGY